jgi:PleD family two-component response regulator
MLFTERLRLKLVTAPWLHQPVTLSMGVATLGDDVQDMQHLIFRADEALYRSKRTGKSRATAWAPEVLL